MNQCDAELGDNLRKNRNVDNYAYFRDGDTDPSSGKTISKVIMSDPDYIVYLDKDLRIEWSVTEEYEQIKGEYSELFSEVVTRVTELEGLSETFQLPKNQLQEYRTLLGAAIATMLEKEKPTIIREVLKKAATYLNDRMMEKARSWYLVSSMCVGLIVLILLLFLVLLRGEISEFAFHVLFATAMGGFGASFYNYSLQ